MAYLLGIDVGTSSSKAMVMDETGRLISCGSSAYDIDIPQPGFAQQDCLMLWDAVSASIRQALAGLSERKAIAAVGITGQMHGLVMLDETLTPIRPCIIWADQRSVRQLEAVKRAGAEARTGNPAATGFLLPSLLWVKENEPANFDRMRYAVLPKDYIRLRLCGELGTDYSDATGTLLYDLTAGGWDTQTIARCGLDARTMPDCRDSCEIAGAVTAQCERETGLRAGTPVVYGGGDTPMQLTGNGVIGVGQLSTNIGTAGQINCICKNAPQSGGQLNAFHHIPVDRWVAVGASLNGGIVLKWMRSTLFNGKLGYEDMDADASRSAPGANGLVLLPFLCGERAPYLDEHAKGILYGMQLSHTRSDIVRCAMESVIYSFRDCMRVFEELRFPMQDEIIASGGGAKSPIWLQMQADILQKAIRVSEQEESACRGAAIAAGVGCGLYGSLEQGCEAVCRLSKTIYEPNPATASVYTERFLTYRALYSNNRELFRRG